MKSWLRNNIFPFKSWVLMYHRIAKETIDPWDISVCPEHFEQQTINKEINLLAYPYGNCNTVTTGLAKQECFNAAFTTESKPVNLYTKRFELGRKIITNRNMNLRYFNSVKENK